MWKCCTIGPTTGGDSALNSTSSISRRCDLLRQALRQDKTPLGIFLGAGITGPFTYTASDRGDGTFSPVMDSEGAEISQVVVAASWHPIPETVMLMAYIKVIGTGTGTLSVVLKG